MAVHWVDVVDDDEDSESGESDDSDAEYSVSSSMAGSLPEMLYVGNFPPYVKELQIRSHFSDFAKFIKKVNVKSKETKGYAFVTFSSGQVADDAQQILDGSKLMGKYQIKVNHAIAKVSSDVRKNKRIRKKRTKIFVGNLPSHVKETDLTQHFAKYQHDLVGHPEIKRSVKGDGSVHCFAFLTFRSQKVAESAIQEVNKTKLLQRSITVQLKKGKRNQQQIASAVTTDKLLAKSHKPVSTSQTSIRVTGIPTNLEKDDIEDLLPNSSSLLSCQLSNGAGPLREEIMSFTSADSASEAITMLDGKTFFEQTLPASIANPHLLAKGAHPDCVTIRIFNLPENSTKKDVLHHFQEFGRIVQKVEVIENSAYITFSTVEQATRAIVQRHNTIFKGSLIGVVMEPTQASAGRRLYANQVEVTRKMWTVKVSNLPKTWTGANVFNNFKQFGRMKSRVKVNRVKDETAPNYAYVSFFNKEDAHKALSVNGKLVQGAKLKVVMKDKADSQPATDGASPNSHPLPPPLIQMTAHSHLPAQGTGILPICQTKMAGLHPTSNRTAIPVTSANSPPALLHSHSTPHPFDDASHLPSGNSLLPCPSYTSAGGHLPLSLKATGAPPVSHVLPPLAPPHLGFSGSPTSKQLSMTPELFHFIENQARQEIVVFRSKGGSFYHSGDLAVIQASNGQELSSFVDRVLGSYKECRLSCSADQWNKLVLISTQGTRLVDELKEPFKSNPNVQIHELSGLDQLQLLFVGVCNAVDSTFSHFSAAFNKELQVESLIMRTLTELKPGLTEDISKRSGTSIDGCSQHSAQESLHDDTQNVQQAREEFKQHVSFVSVYHIPTEFPLQLLNSAMKLLQDDGLHVVILEDVTGKHIGSFSDTDIQKVKKVLGRTPYRKSIPLQGELSFLSEDMLEEIYSNDCVRVRLEKRKIVIEGFVEEDVQQAWMLLQKSMKVITNSLQCLVCSPEQNEYLLHMFALKKLKTSLPASVSLSKDKSKLFLKGTQDERDASTRILLESVPLHYRSCPFTCHPALYSQIEQQVLNQHTTVERIKKESQHEKEEGKKGAHSFSIILFASNLLDLETAMADLQNIEPGSLTVSVRPKAQGLLRDCKTPIEKQYNCRLEIKVKPSSRVVVHALTEEDRVEAKVAIGNYICENLVVEKEIPDIPLSALQMKYLLVKHKSKLNEMKVSLEYCKIPHYLERKDAIILREEVLRVKVKGKLKQVEEAKESMDELAMSFAAEAFEVHCHPAKLQMWHKRWKLLKEEQEESSELMVEYDASDKPATATESSDIMNIPFVVYGSDTEAVRELKKSIQEEMLQELECVTLEFSQDQVKAVGVGLKNRRLNTNKCIVDIRFTGSKIVLSAPKVAADDLLVVKNEIKNFLGNKTMSAREFSSDSAAVNLLLTSKKQYGFFSLARKIAQEVNVSVLPVHRGSSAYLNMRGSPVALEAAHLKLMDLVPRIKQSLTTKKVDLEPLVAPALVPSFCQQLQVKLQKDYCVVATILVQQIPVSVLKAVCLQPSSSAIKIKIELHKGSLLSEKVDVIVNPANEDLKHCQGLAKIVADGGGPSIQRESTQHVQKNGKLKSGKAICLGAGNLPYKKVIHAVGPRWQGGGNQEKQTLYLAVFNSLSIASSHGFGSIAFPAIGTGVFCVPEDLCASMSLKAVRDFCQLNSNSSIHTVIFSLFAPAVQKAFVAALQFMASSEQIQEIQHGRQPLSWEWMNDQGSFSPYSPEVCQFLTAKFEKNSQGCASIAILGRTYTIDFKKMLQSDISTGSQRRIRKSGNAKCSNWSFLGDDKQHFIPYSYQQASAIEAMYQAGASSTLDIHGRTYTFDFQQMVQVNVQSRYRRPIQRTRDLQTPKERPTTTDHTSSTKGQEKKELFITLEGPAMLIGQAKEELRTMLQRCIQTETISLPRAPHKRFEQNLKKKAQRHGVLVKVISIPSGQAAQKTKVELIGVKARVERATREIQQLIIDQQSSSDSIDFPPEWQSQTQTTELQLVVQGSPEWTRVERKFKATMSSSIIVEIIRVQNTWLWERYIQHKKMMQKKNGAAGVNELELFHGTGGNDPRYVFEGEEGFDMRFSAQGMWGHANYFAVNASYSNSYAHTNTHGQKEMFLAKVLTGDSYQCSSNPSLRMPPEKQSRGQVQFFTNRYDTVMGHTNGSQVYMTYDNQKAFPAYMIRYN